MGTFSTINIDPDLPETELVRLGLTCRDGHPQNAELQTKDLGQDMEQYMIGRGLEVGAPLRLYGPAAKVTEHRVELTLAGPAHLVEVRRTKFPLSTFTGTLLVYTHCDDCLPVFFERPGGFWGNIDKREVFVELDLTFQNGKLVKVDAEQTRNVSREQLRVQMLKDGVAVLPDDDRLVKREIEAWKKKNEDVDGDGLRLVHAAPDRGGRRDHAAAHPVAREEAGDGGAGHALGRVPGGRAARNDGLLARARGADRRRRRRRAAMSTERDNPLVDADGTPLQIGDRVRWADNHSLGVRDGVIVERHVALLDHQDGSVGSVWWREVRKIDLAAELARDDLLLLPRPAEKKKLELVDAPRPDEESPHVEPPAPVTTDEDLCAYPLHDRVREMLEGGFTPDEARVFLLAFQAQSQDRVPRDESSSSVTVDDPYLVRFIVRRRDAGPIRVVLGGKLEIVNVEARAACIRGILLVPGAPCVVEPADAILLGKRLSPRQCIEHYAAG
jgi:hypothetical protein